MSPRAPLALCALALCSLSGAVRARPESDPWPALARFARDPSLRRRALEGALRARTQGYGRRRLAQYETPDGPWRERSVPPRVALLTEANRVAFAQGELPSPSAEPWPTQPPATLAEARALGQRAFRSFPMALETGWDLVLDTPSALDSLGVQREPDGTLVGLVLVETSPDEWHAAETCALCHGPSGEPNRALDYGALLTLSRPDASAAQQASWHRWGRGRLDVSRDDDDDPLRIPTLRGIISMGYLQASCAQTLRSPSELALRIDTLLLDSTGALCNPPATLAAALGAYLVSLAAPPAPRVDNAPAVFAERCAGCHSGPALGGERCVPAERLAVDPSAARSADRGTGSYRVAPLRGLGASGLLLHDGSARSVRELLRTHPTPGERVSEGEARDLARWLGDAR